MYNKNDSEELKQPLLEDNEEKVQDNSSKKDDEIISQGVFNNNMFNSQIVGSVLCLLCITFGSGLLALPYSLVKLGLVLGFFVFLISAFCVYWTTMLLLKVAYQENTIDYSALIGKFLGHRQTIVYEIVNVVINFGSIIVYQQIITNFFFSTLQYIGITIHEEYPRASRFIQMYTFCIFTQIPLTFSKNIELLMKVSYYGTLALFYTVVVSLIESPFYFEKNYSYEKLKYWDLNISIFKVICIYFFSFANHNAVLNVISEVKNNNLKIALKISRIQYFVLLSIYSTVMLSAYLSTFSETKEIFIDRPGQSIFLVFGKFFYILSLTCHIGLYYYISRPSIEKLFIRQKLSPAQNYITGTLSLLVLTYLAYCFESIVNVISVLGATCDCYLVFVMPILLYLKSNPKRNWKRYFSIFILIVCLSIASINLITQFLDIFYHFL